MAKLGDRSEFPDLRARAYLNHAAVSPASRPVREAVAKKLEAYAKDGVAALLAGVEERRDLRARLATLVGAERGSDIAFLPNTTRAVTDVALCFPWRACGHRVLVSEGEFPADVTPWQRAAQLYDLEVAFLPQPHPATFEKVWWPAFIEALDEGAALVAVSAVQFRPAFACRSRASAKPVATTARSYSSMPSKPPAWCASTSSARGSITSPAEATSG